MRRIIYSMLAGILGGIIMALIVLYLMRITGFMIQGSSAGLCMVIAAVLPSCMNVFHGNESINVFQTELMMIGISFLITLIYAFYITHASSYAQSYSSNIQLILGYSFLLHGISLGVTAVIHLLHRKKDRS